MDGDRIPIGEGGDGGKTSAEAQLDSMRQRRLKAPASFPAANYHRVSRVVDRRFVFGELEREQFVRYLREDEVFSAARVLTYCILSNPFHLLVEVRRNLPTYFCRRPSTRKETKAGS